MLIDTHNTPPSLPAYYDSLEASLAKSWQLLVAGITDRRCAFNTPVVAGIDLHGKPTARTMILRGVAAESRTLIFYSDIRATKIAEWRDRSDVCVIAYDDREKIQLRISGRVSLHSNDEIANAAWQNSRAMSRLSYNVDNAPGAVIIAPMTLPASQVEIIDDLTDEESGDLPELIANLGRKNFCVAVVQVDAIEWVYLASQGNRRALFSWTNDTLQSVWLQP